MLSGIKGLAYALLFISLFIYFLASGFFQTLINGISKLADLFGSINYFFREYPFFSLISALIGVYIFLALILSFKNTK